MRIRFRTMFIYLAAALALSCLDVTYEWSSPIIYEESGETIEWAGIAGVRQGAFFIGNHEGSRGHVEVRFHTPKIFPIPFFAGAGPDSGGLLIAIWLAALVVGGLHAAIAKLRAKRDVRSHPGQEPNLDL